MVAATAEKPKKTETQTENLYWFGALPASAPVPYQFPTRERQGTGQFFKVENQSAYDLWEKQNRIWIGKCRFIQNLFVKGLSFPAFTEFVERQATLDDEMSRTAFPGAVEIMRDEDIKAVIKSAWRHVVRYGKGNDDIMSLKNAANGGVSPVRVINLDANETDAQIPASDRRYAIGESLTFDPFKDKYMAEFVYLVKIEGDVRQFRDANGNLSLGACVDKLPAKRLGPSFFSAPPASLAEMYPQSGA